MTMAPLAAWLVSRYDWRTTLLLLAAVAAALMLPAAALVRRAPRLVAQMDHAAAESSPGPAWSVRQVLRSPAFMILLATNFFCCATHSGPIFHTVSYATTCGISLVAAVTIYSVEGIAGLFGRVAFGFLGDRFGAKRILVLGLLAQALAALAYLSAGSLNTFYSVAALFGFIYSGVMPLYSVIARENFPLRMMGTVIGGLAMAGSLGMAVGPAAGGFIFDAFVSYAWLFIGSFALGMGAFLISLTIRPLKLGGALLAGTAVG
jgi:predicted MFS family arabinose efflux permease